ncbi:MAG: helix-turn-helix domain-containing protein [Thaumarchaeota archaeon]|nr:helix-turn-helix domain-containing protein [Nitrososphaerota archaeon]
MNAQTTTVDAVETKSASLLTLGPETAGSILAALADRFSGKIMTRTIDDARTVEAISSSEGIPLSTCYRRMHALVGAGLVVIERIVITGSGKRYASYRSCYRSFRISADPHGIVVQAETNKEAFAKLWGRHISNGYGYAGHSLGVQ